MTPAVPWPTVAAVALALTGACLFALAAVLQHGAVRAHGLASGWRRRNWLFGALAAAGGSGVHAVALGLAPLAVVQPVGVLAVPLGVLFERRVRRPGRAGTGAALACSVGGVALFTSTTATAATGATVAAGPVDPARVLIVVALVALPAAGIAALSGRWTGTARCLARALPAAAAFGLVSALLRALLGTAAHDPAGAAVLGAALAVVLGGGVLALQGAYGSGPPSLAVACLTVVDPLVAVGTGTVALGERIAAGTAGAAVATAGAGLAVAGVLLLARHHPDARRGARPDPAPEPVPAPSLSSSSSSSPESSSGRNTS